MLIKLIEIFKQPGDRMRLDEVYVSGDAVTSIRSDNQMLSEAVELGISPDASFSRVTINEGGIARTIEYAILDHSPGLLSFYKSTYDMKTVPIVVYFEEGNTHGKVIGGYTDLVEHFAEKIG